MKMLLGRLYVYKFLIELLLCSGMFVFPLPRRKYFPIRITAALIICAALSSYWTLALAQVVAFSIYRYLVLFVAVTLSIWGCFDCSLWIALFCGMGGYATQHLFYKLYQVLITASGKQSDLWNAVWYLLLLAAVLICVGRLFTRHIHRNNYQSMENRKNLLLCGLILLCTIVFSTIYGVYANTAPVPLLLICSLYDCICCGFSLWVQFGMFQLDRMKQEMTVVEQLWRQDKKQMAVSQENIDLINIKCHDMKHLIARMAAQGKTATEGELQDIQRLINIYDFSVNTGNNVLNLILAEKSLLCEKAGIQLNCIADGEKLGFMEDSDIYSLLGNTLDNAIMAVQGLPDQRKRVITLTIQSALGMLSVCAENYYQGELVFEDGLPVTNKPDKEYHGYGMKSMRYLVQKYHGEITVKAEAGIFTVNMLFPCE